MTNAGGYGRLHESLVRNAARRVESNKPWHDSRPREAPCNGGVDPYPIRHGHRRIVLLEVAASGRVEPRRVKLRVSTRPISDSSAIAAWLRSYGSRRQSSKFTSL